MGIVQFYFILIFVPLLFDSLRAGNDEERPPMYYPGMPYQAPPPFYMPPYGQPMPRPMHGQPMPPTAYGYPAPYSGMTAPAYGYPAPHSGMTAPAYGYPAPYSGMTAPAYGYPAPHSGMTAPAYAGSSQSLQSIARPGTTIPLTLAGKRSELTVVSANFDANPVTMTVQKDGKLYNLKVLHYAPGESMTVHFDGEKNPVTVELQNAYG